MKRILMSLGVVLCAAAVHAEGVSRWIGDGDWHSAINGTNAATAFHMDLIVHEAGLGFGQGSKDPAKSVAVEGLVYTPYGNYSLMAGYWLGDKQRLSLVFTPRTVNDADVIWWLRGHVSERRLYTAELFELVKTSEDEAAHDALTQAMRGDLGMPAGMVKDRVIRPLGGASAFSR